LEPAHGNFKSWAPASPSVIDAVFNFMTCNYVATGLPMGKLANVPNSCHVQLAVSMTSNHVQFAVSMTSNHVQFAVSMTVYHL